MTVVAPWNRDGATPLYFLSNFGYHIDVEWMNAVMGHDEELTFKIEAYSPETMPMSRLAEYLAQLAAILGEEKAVHFVRLAPGSTQVVHRIESEAVPKVMERAASVRRGDGTADARKAYKKINRLLREDNRKGVLKEETTGAEIIYFPGVEHTEEKFSGIKQRGAIDGEVIRVGGTDKWIPILMRPEADPVANCMCSQDMAKRLGRHLFEPVRLFGTGKWTRDTEGKWNLDIFFVDDFEPLIEETLSQAISRIAAVPTEWDATCLAELASLRGEMESENGGI